MSKNIGVLVAAMELLEVMLHDGGQVWVDAKAHCDDTDHVTKASDDEMREAFIQVMEFGNGVVWLCMRTYWDQGLDEETFTLKTDATSEDFVVLPEAKIPTLLVEKLVKAYKKEWPDAYEKVRANKEG